MNRLLVWKEKNEEEEEMQEEIKKMAILPYCGIVFPIGKLTSNFDFIPVYRPLSKLRNLLLAVLDCAHLGFIRFPVLVERCILDRLAGQ